MKSFQATDCSYLVVTRNSDSDPECERIHGTFKIRGLGSFAIENCGGCDCTVVIQKIEDSAFHSTYDESNPRTDETQLPIAVLNFLTGWPNKILKPEQ